MHTEAPISINLKSASGLTQLTLRANTPDEFTALTSAIFQITEAIGEVETAVRGAVPVNAAVPPNPVVGMLATQLGGTVIPETPTQAGPPAFVSPGAGARQCPHGTMTRIHGLTGKFGPYKGHFCPAKQGDPTKCTTVYVKANTPEFATFTADQTKA
jgi:hypothetical protein